MIDYDVERAIMSITSHLEVLPISQEVRSSIMTLLINAVGKWKGPLPDMKMLPTSRRQQASTYYKTSVARRELIGEGLVHDPVWLILLDLFVAVEDGRSTTIGVASNASQVPATTALRTLGVMEKRGLVKRFDVPGDRRRIYIEPTEFAMRAVLTSLEMALPSLGPKSPEP